MDLNLHLAQSSDEGADMALRHPVTDEVLHGDDEQPIVFRLAGSDSGRWRRKIKQLGARLAEKRNRKLTPDQAEAQGAELLACVTLGWSENFTVDGEPLPFSEDAARKLYLAQPWIREQVDLFVGDRANFLLDSKTS